MIVVVSCGQRKAERPTPAGYLYTGAYVSAALRWARSVAPTSRIFILSVRHGLLPHDTITAPYEMTMRDPQAATLARLQRQAREYAIEDEPEVVVVGGVRYVARARGVWPHAIAPFSGPDRRMGKQLQSLNRSRGRVPRVHHP